MNRHSRRILAAALGGVLGYLSYAAIGCTGGACPLTGNPWIAAGCGAAFGAALAWQAGDQQRKEENGRQTND